MKRRNFIRSLCGSPLLGCAGLKNPHQDIIDAVTTMNNCNIGATTMVFPSRKVLNEMVKDWGDYFTVKEKYNFK